MANFDINRNKERLTEADIAKGQNFEQFMNAYSATKPSFFRTKKFYAIAAAAGLIILVGTWVMVQNDEQAVAQTPGYIQPLFDGAGDADTTFTVDAAKGGTLMNSNGSMIHVPAHAFLDSSGGVVTGNVEIRYREFHDPAKIFMAGIPMQYDSGGATYHFESAGMIEITAWQGKPLKTNPDSLIHVAMVSNSAESRFNTYYLDTAAKNWKYITNEPAIVFNLAAHEAADSVVSVTDIGEPPVAPRIATRNAPSFAIQFSATEFPELVAYKGVRFEVDELQTPYNKEDKKVAWEDVTIERVKNKEDLRITFSAGMKEAVYITHPVVDEKDFAAAKASWEQRNAEYLKLKQQKDAQEEKEAQEQMAMMEQRERHRVWFNDSIAGIAASRRVASSLQSKTQDLVMREFEISSFGIWNADYPESLPQGMEVFAKAVDEHGNELDCGKFYLVEKGKNALYMYMASHMNAFGYDPEAENMIWAVTNDGKLAVVSVDDFKNATAGGKKEVTFKFTVTAGKVKNGAEARRLLDIPSPAGM